MQCPEKIKLFRYANIVVFYAARHKNIYLKRVFFLSHNNNLFKKYQHFLKFLFENVFKYSNFEYFSSMIFLILLSNLN